MVFNCSVRNAVLVMVVANLVELYLMLAAEHVGKIKEFQKLCHSYWKIIAQSFCL